MIVLEVPLAGTEAFVEAVAFLADEAPEAVVAFVAAVAFTEDWAFVVPEALVPACGPDGFWVCVVPAAGADAELCEGCAAVPGCTTGDAVTGAFVTVTDLAAGTATEPVLLLLPPQALNDKAAARMAATIADLKAISFFMLFSIFMISFFVFSFVAEQIINPVSKRAITPKLKKRQFINTRE